MSEEEARPRPHPPCVCLLVYLLPHASVTSVSAANTSDPAAFIYLFIYFITSFWEKRCHQKQAITREMIQVNRATNDWSQKLGEHFGNLRQSYGEETRRLADTETQSLAENRIFISRYESE